MMAVMWNLRINFLLFALILNLVTIAFVGSTNGGKAQVYASEVFEYERREPGNELGIFTKVIAHIFRPANSTTDDWRLNRAYLPNEIYENLLDKCVNDIDPNPEEVENEVKWSGCTSDENGLFVYASHGRPEPKNKTVTYLELEFRPFKRVNKKGKEEVCILDEVYKNKAYIVLRTHSEYPSNDTKSRESIESVATVHQHQLDEFGEHFLSIFEDQLDIDAVYSFGIDEYYDRDPPYECFLSIGSSESTTVIEEKCDFYCPDPTGLSAKELEKVLLQAKMEADEEEEREDHEGFSEQVHDEL